MRPMKLDEIVEAIRYQLDPQEEFKEEMTSVVDEWVIEKPIVNNITIIAPDGSKFLIHVKRVS